MKYFNVTSFGIICLTLLYTKCACLRSINSTIIENGISGQSTPKNKIQNEKAIDNLGNNFDQFLSNQLLRLIDFNISLLLNEHLSYDGWFHYLNELSDGSKGSSMIRHINSDHSFKSDFPNVFLISESLLKDDNLHFSQSSKNLLFVHFGMFILNEILDSDHPRCPSSYQKIYFPKTYLGKHGERVDYISPTKHSFMYLNKAEHCKLNRNLINTVKNKINYRSVWIDGEIIYGDSKYCSDMARTMKNGRLKDFDDSINLTNFAFKCFNYFGSKSVNENPFTLVIHFVWVRWHNLIADTIHYNHPNLSDEIVYQEARKITIATIQHIFFDEWVPQLLGFTLSPYAGYQPEVNSQITHLFDSTIYLYIYSLITPFVFKLSSDCSKGFQYSLTRTCNSYENPFDNLSKDFESILVGMLLQSAQRDDHFIVEDVRSFAKGPLDFTREDIVAIQIQQSRNFAVPDYLTVRKKLGLDSNVTYSSFDQLANTLWTFATRTDKNLIRKMNILYENDINKIDLFIGGILECDGKGPGPLFSRIMREQFQRIRDGDRMYFENIDNNLFAHNQIKVIRQIQFSEILKLVTSLNEGLIQPNAFSLPNDKHNKISERCQNSLQNLLLKYSCNEQSKCLTLVHKKNIKSLNKCSVGVTYDYFSGSELSFILTLILILTYVLFLLLLLRLLVISKQKYNDKIRLKMSKLRRMTISENSILVQEWIDNREGYRNVEVILSKKTKSIKVKLEHDSHRVVRCIYLKGVVGKVTLEFSNNKSQNHVLVRVPKEYDLVLKFDSYYEREKFSTKFEVFLLELFIPIDKTSLDLNSILKNAYTKAKRQEHLEQFFRVVFFHAFNKKTSENIDLKTAKEIIETELTQFEFAEVLSMRPESTFVQQMYCMMDKDNNGYISFREFLDVIIIFAKGTAEQKIKIMFDIYDVNQSGRLSVNDFKSMIKSLLEIVNQSISSFEMDQTIQSMFSEIGFINRKEITFDDFNKLFNNYKEELGYSELNFDLSNIEKLQSMPKRNSRLIRANDTIVRAYSYFGGKSGMDFSKQAPSFLKIETQENRKDLSWIFFLVRFVDTKKREIFVVVFYSLIVVFIFVDKAYYYSYLNETSGLRQIAGLGVTLTRGTASVLMFNFSTILVTMCRNLITFLRETFLHKYIPFDGTVTFHKYIAFLAFVMSIIHAVGHMFNFYHISTQRPSDLNCIFRETYFVQGELPKFHKWCLQTLTGITGILLLCLLFTIYIFAVQYSRRHVFNAFWKTHSLYPLFYILIVLHGLGKLIQPPIFYMYFLLPVTLFTIDRLISASRKRIEISVIKATLHPSDVTHLEFKKPANFEYKSGQWLRIACLELNRNEYHPFTIASAPHEDTLSLYIRAVGPFTKNLRQMYDHNSLNGRPYPKLYIDGPYGEGHQDWLKFDVCVLVGGGIGITPFASIIKDISFRSSINAKITCQKVYFLWVTRTQKHFEWMSDVIREAESKDQNNLLVTHIFITQFHEKFDLRTTMLYICERHFQRISNKSLFTGLKAKTHFGRPNFKAFLDSLQQEHPMVERVGVFSCGPNPMTTSVQQACESLNRREGAIFQHHFENF